MSDTSYSVARVAAVAVRAFYARHPAYLSAEPGGVRALVPSENTIVELIEAAFWASLRREEGRAPLISLAFVPPDRTGHPLIFAESLPLAAGALARLAPAVEHPGVHLGVWREGDSLRVWGSTRTLPELCFVIEVVEPGLLVLKFRRSASLGKYGNIAVLRGDSVRVIDEDQSYCEGYSPLFAALFAALLDVQDAEDDARDAGTTLLQLAVSMRQHKRGGALLVVPRASNGWTESIVHPVSYAVDPPFTRLSDLLRLPPGERGKAGGRDGVPKVIESIAGLTAVDGAAIVDDRFAVLAFGAKIVRPDGRPMVEQVRVLEPITGDIPALVPPVQLGGTRHLSAAQFVHDQRDALALVASQDGAFTVFVWSHAEGMVHSHRIEALLF